MFHIACGESVPYNDWFDTVKKALSASKHLTVSANVMWGDKLLNRAFEPENCKENRLTGRTRKEFSPKRLAACQSELTKVFMSYKIACNFE